MAKPQENVQAVVDVKKEPDDVLVGNNDVKFLDQEVKTENSGLFHVSQEERKKEREFMEEEESRRVALDYYVDMAFNSGIQIDRCWIQKTAYW